MRNILSVCILVLILSVISCSSDEPILNEKYIMEKYIHEDGKKLQEVLSEEDFEILSKAISKINIQRVTTGESDFQADKTYREILEEAKNK